MSSWLVLFNAPFSIPQMDVIRMKLLKEMGDRGFSHYVAQMNTLEREMDAIASDDAKILDDDYWSRDICKDTYWEKESPWLDQDYYRPKKAWRLWLAEPTGISTLTTMFFTDAKAQLLLGDAYWMTVQQKILFKSIIGTYYNNNKRLWPVHLNMDYTFRQISAAPDESKGLFFNILQSALAGSGTFILKILQQINTANETKLGDSKVSELAASVFGSVPGLTPEEFAYMRPRFRIRPEFIDNMNPKMLGSASLAEAHFTYATIQGVKVEAVLKFVKPLYAYLFLCECNYLLTTVWKKIAEVARQVPSSNSDVYIKQCRLLLMFFVAEFSKEFNYKSEFRNTTLGYPIYNVPSRHVRSIVALDVAVDPFPALVVQRVNGQTLDNLLQDGADSKETAQTLYPLVVNLNAIWFSNTLWGNGFFHSDLHPGNAMLAGKDLYCIDYGSAGVLEPEQRCKIITAMLLSSKLYFTDAPKTPEQERDNYINIAKFVKVILELCQVQDIRAEDIEFITNYIYKANELWFSSMFLDVIARAPDIGACSHNAVLMFGRGAAYLSSMLRKIVLICDDPQKYPLLEAQTLIAPNLLRHPGQLLRFAVKGVAC
jgi:hypothetical protein